MQLRYLFANTDSIVSDVFIKFVVNYGYLAAMSMLNDYAIHVGDDFLGAQLCYHLVTIFFEDAFWGHIDNNHEFVIMCYLIMFDLFGYGCDALLESAIQLLYSETKIGFCSALHEEVFAEIEPMISNEFRRWLVDICGLPLE